MKFVKIEHLRVHGHTLTLHHGRLLLRRLVDSNFSRFEHDEEKSDRDTKNHWREEFRQVEHTFEHGTPEECLDVLTTLYDDEALPDEISAELEPLLKKLQQPRGPLISYIYYQSDLTCDIQWIEDGHDRTPPDPDNPTCTIVCRNGQWRHVLGSAEETVAKITGRTS